MNPRDRHFISGLQAQTQEPETALRWQKDSPLPKGRTFATRARPSTGRTRKVNRKCRIAIPWEMLPTCRYVPWALMKSRHCLEHTPAARFVRMNNAQITQRTTQHCSFPTPRPAIETWESRAAHSLAIHLCPLTQFCETLIDQAPGALIQSLARKTNSPLHGVLHPPGTLRIPYWTATAWGPTFLISFKVGYLDLEKEPESPSYAPPASRSIRCCCCC
jgi:hypothetical protein